MPTDKANHGELTKDTDIYKENVNFWERAWAPVKTAYTQMPDLPYLKDIPKKLKDANVKTVLDLGCGSGWLSIYLARQGFSVTGIDIAPQALNLGQQWAAQENLSIKFEVGDVTSLNFPESSFDAIVANSIFEHLTLALAKETISQMAQVLKPGGLFFGCFDLVGTGPGEYFELNDQTHVYTDKARQGMLLRCFSDVELKQLFQGWQIHCLETIESGSRLVWASPKD